MVIVLGCRQDSETINDRLKDRMDVGLNCFVSNNADFLILSGGKTTECLQYSESGIMKSYALSRGIPGEKIITESNSRDTIENAFYCRKIVDRLNGVEKIYVVSSCYHMKRAEFIFIACFGLNMKMNFDCCHRSITRRALKEFVKLREARIFFNGITPGSINTIEERLSEPIPEHDPR